MAHFVRQNAQECPHRSIPGGRRLLFCNEGAAIVLWRRCVRSIAIVIVRRPEDPVEGVFRVVVFAEADMRPLYRALMLIATRRSFGRVGIELFIREPDHDRLIAEVVPVRILKIGVSRDGTASFENKAAAGNRVPELDHRVDVAVHPLEHVARRCASQTGVVQHAVVEHPDCDRVRDVPFCTRMAICRVIEKISGRRRNPTETGGCRGDRKQRIS
jgi:hypothetical protein